jgi:hypothetical protein
MMSKTSSPYLRQRDARRRQGCGSAIVWSAEVAAACALPTEAMHLPSSIATTPALMTMTNLGYSPERGPAPVGSMMSGETSMIWKGLKTCVFPSVLSYLSYLVDPQFFFC